MMRNVIILLIVLITSMTSICCEKGQTESDFVPVTVFDPDRDAERDIKLAVKEANRTGRFILLEVGGDWCTWCRKFDDFFEEHAEITDYLHKNFILVKINFSPDNRNKDILETYPAIIRYPHLFILNTSGNLIHSQSTAEFEEGKIYHRDKVLNFLQKWKLNTN